MSNNIENNWIEAIKQKAEQATREVPEGTWDAISKSLPQQAPKESSTKRGRVAPRMWKAIAAAASVAIVITTGVMVFNTSDEQQPQQLAQQVEKQKPLPQPQQQLPGNDTTATSTNQVPSAAATPIEPTLPPSIQSQLAKNSTPQPKQAVTESPAPTLAKNNSPATPASLKPRHSKPGTTRHHSIKVGPPHTTTPLYNDDNEPVKRYLDEEEEYYANEYDQNEFDPDEYFYDIETMKALEELYAEYDNAMNQEAMEPWKAYSDSTYQQHLIYDANARRAAREKMALTKPHKKPTMLLAAYGNGLISTDRNATVNGSSAQMLTPPATSSNMMMAPAAPGVTPRVAPPVNYNYHHHMPLTAGATFNKQIVKNLYGSIGLNFTSMTSDVTPDNGNPEFKQNIKLIGLPFGVKWNFWKYRGLSTFIGGEALVERVVSAKFNNESLSIKRLQWSVHATAGMQYNFTRNVGIYISPKLSHYITTMPLNTQRNEHPLNFNLQLGLSFDF